MMTTIGILIDDGAIEATSGFASGEHNQDGVGVPHMRPFNVTTEGRVSLRQIKSVALPGDATRLLTRGDVLFNNTNTEELVGKTAYWDSDARYAFSNHMTRVRVVDSARVHSRYLALALHREWMAGQSQQLCRRHVAQASIIGQRFRELSFELPPLETQRRIASVLSLVQRAIEAEDRIIAHTREFKLAVMSQLFTHGIRNRPQKETASGLIPEGWEVRSIKDIFDCHDGLRIPVRQEDRRPGPYPYYGASGVVDHVDAFLFEGEFLLVAEDGENLETRKLPIAFIASGRFWVNNHAHVLSNRAGNLKFFEQFISYMDIRDYLTGTTRPKLNKGLLMQIQVPFPNDDEQAEIAHILTVISREIAIHELERKTLLELFRRLLDQLMKGEILVDNVEIDTSEMVAA